MAVVGEHDLPHIVASAEARRCMRTEVRAPYGTVLWCLRHTSSFDRRRDVVETTRCRGWGGCRRLGPGYLLRRYPLARGDNRSAVGRSGPFRVQPRPSLRFASSPTFPLFMWARRRWCGLGRRSDGFMKQTLPSLQRALPERLFACRPSSIRGTQSHIPSSARGSVSLRTGGRDKAEHTESPCPPTTPWLRRSCRSHGIEVVWNRFRHRLEGRCYVRGRTLL
jgi:hypothetical protein